VAVATPVATHAALGRQVLESGRHCFVEKPLAQSVRDAKTVLEAARAAHRALMVGHLLEYHRGLERLDELTWSSASCAFTPASSRICTCPGSTRTRSVASPWWGRSEWRTSDDMALEQKLTVYDKGFDQSYPGYGEYIARSGDVWSPQISNEEPLRIECRHVVDCILDGLAVRSDGEAGLRVVRVLEALQRSLEESARPSL